MRGGEALARPKTLLYQSSQRDVTSVCKINQPIPDSYRVLSTEKIAIKRTTTVCGISLGPPETENMKFMSRTEHNDYWRYKSEVFQHPGILIFPRQDLPEL